METKTKYITIKEAASLSGKSEYSIRLWAVAKFNEELQAQQAQQAQEAIGLIEPIVKKDHQTKNPNSPLCFFILENEILKVFGKAEVQNIQQPQAQQARQARQPQQPPQQPLVEDYIGYLKGEIAKRDESIKELKMEVKENRGQVNYLVGQLLQLNAPKKAEPVDAESVTQNHA